MRLINRPCTILRRAQNEEVVDDYGNPLETATSTNTVCELQQRQRGEVGRHGDFSRTEWTLFLPADTEIDTGDAVVVDGREFEMVGEPWNVRSASSGRPSHVEATVRRAGATDEGPDEEPDE